MNYLKILLFSVLSLMIFTQCKEEGNVAKGQFQMELTDAPTDDANVKGVFVTVAEVKIDGETFSGFSGKKTIDVKAYQNGKTEVLGLGELEAGSYSNISLVLDYEADANGNAPGCYVLTANDEKENLAASGEKTAEIVLAENFTIDADSKTTLVADFDLRKSIAYENQEKTQYKFASQSELKTAIRVVNKEEASNVQGNCSDSFSNSDMIVVYAYKKGTYNRDTEVSGSGNATFSNSVTSAAVKANGDFQLSFLDEGEYEVVFASYKDENNDGTFELSGTLSLLADLGVNLGSISVGANANVNLNVVVTGMIPI